MSPEFNNVTVQVRRVPSLFVTSLSLCFVGLLLFVALVYDRYDLAALCLLLVILSVGLKLWVHVSPSGMEWDLSVETTRIFAGESCALKARAQNRKFLPVWMEVSIPVASPRSEETRVTAESSLLWYQAAHFTWEVTALKRGVTRIGTATITTGDLFGFFTTERERTEAAAVIVYPRLVPLRPISLQRLEFFGTPGGKSPVTDPAYILGTTDYRQGRPARFIHWKATARHHRVQEKVFESTRQEKVLLVVDTEQFFQRRAEDPFERTLEVVASLAVQLDRQGCALGLLTNGVTGGGPLSVPVSRSPGRLTAILEALSRLDVQPGETMAEVLRRLPGTPWGTTCLYFAYEEDDAARVAKAHLMRCKAPVLFFAFGAVLGLLSACREEAA